MAGARAFRSSLLLPVGDQRPERQHDDEDRPLCADLPVRRDPQEDEEGAGKRQREGANHRTQRRNAPADELTTAQDHASDFPQEDTLLEWTGRWRRDDRGDDDQIVRATLGQLLFTGDDARKSVKVVSGGEEQRLIFGKLVLQMPNIMLLDEPTNHLDMESIESLNTALEKYPGTLIFVSHDREFVSSLATRVIEMRPDADGGPAQIIDYQGGYEDYLAAQSND